MPANPTPRIINKRIIKILLICTYLNSAYFEVCQVKLHKNRLKLRKDKI
jgi:hypothetical protein